MTTNDINFMLQLTRHNTLTPIPFNTPVLLLQPCCIPVNVSLVFGKKPMVYTAKTAGNKEIGYDDPEFLTKALIYNSDSDHVYTAAEWLTLRALWCVRPTQATATIHKILDYLRILDDVPDVEDDSKSDDFDEDERF